MKKLTSRLRRRLLREALNKPAPAVEKTSASAAEDPEPHDESLSYQDATSRRAIRYQPHRSKGVQFLDTRRVPYEVSSRGELRAVGKPCSRVKRLREEKRRQERESRNSKQKETDQERAST